MLASTHSYGVSGLRYLGLTKPVSGSATKNGAPSPGVKLYRGARCEGISSAAAPAELQEEGRRVTVANGGNSLELCRVLNGMWQTSGGWGRIDRDDAVEAMLRYSDAGLSTFDMADHWYSFSKISELS
ncbi:hypothetical protein V2J09_020960 [Rumex salicifolius]